MKIFWANTDMCLFPFGDVRICPKSLSVSRQERRTVSCRGFTKSASIWSYVIITCRGNTYLQLLNGKLIYIVNYIYRNHSTIARLRCFAICFCIFVLCALPCTFETHGNHYKLTVSRKWFNEVILHQFMMPQCLWIYRLKIFQNICMRVSAWKYLAVMDGSRGKMCLRYDQSWDHFLPQSMMLKRLWIYKCAATQSCKIFSRKEKKNTWN